MISENRKMGCFDISCDECPNESEVIDSDNGWQAMIDQLRRDHWTIYKDENGDWTHVGPACSEARKPSNPFDFN